MQEGREGEEANNTINTDSNASSKAPAINNKNNDKNDISREAADLSVSKTLATALELQFFSTLSGNKSVTLSQRLPYFSGKIVQQLPYF